MDLITRRFSVQREKTLQYYPFTTYSFIWVVQQDPILEKACQYFRQVMRCGIPEGLVAKSVSGANECIVKLERRDDDLMRFAKDSNYMNRGKFQHEIMEQYLLENDPATMAIEIPVYDDEYLGHIDILRWHNKRFQIVDFKPNAAKEKKAGTQVARYRQLFSKNTGVPERLIDGAYFDEFNSYHLI